jgi:selenocysteine-specific elongation factor
MTAALIERGTLVKVNDSILLERGAYERAVERIVSALHARTSLTVADARDLLGTSRKYMLAIFEHLDERRITRRQGDDRLLGTNAPQPPTTTAASERLSAESG